MKGFIGEIQNRIMKGQGIWSIIPLGLQMSNESLQLKTVAIHLAVSLIAPYELPFNKIIHTRMLFSSPPSFRSTCTLFMSLAAN